MEQSDVALYFTARICRLSKKFTLKLATRSFVQINKRTSVFKANELNEMLWDDDSEWQERVPTH